MEFRCTSLIRSTRRAAAVLLLFLLANGHFGTLQVIAWSRMMWEYSERAGSWVVGAKKTFDGGHPCRMCDSIKDAEGKEEKSKGALVSAKKIELFMREGAEPLPERVCGEQKRPFAMDEWREARFAEPPVPVPIGMVLAA